MLYQKVTIYVPGTMFGNVPAPAAQATWVDRTLGFLAGQFGGATADAPSIGAWMSPELGLIKETVVKVYAFTDVQGLQGGISAVLAFAADMGEAMTQEAVSVEVNGTLRFVKAMATEQDADAA